MKVPSETGKTENEPRADDPVVNVAKTAAVLCAVVVLGCLAMSRFGEAKGFVLGSVFSLANFALMKRGIVRRLGMSSKRAGVEAFFSILLRYVLLAFPLIIAVRSDQISIVATCVGVFNAQISILLYYVGWAHFFRRGITY